MIAKVFQYEIKHDKYTDRDLLMRQLIKRDLLINKKKQKTNIDIKD